MNSKFRINPQLSTTPGPEMQSQWLGKTREKKKKKKHTGGVFQSTILGPLHFFVNVTIPLKIRMKR